MEQWYGLTQEEVLKRLSTNRTGLSEGRGRKRLEVYGENILKRAGRNALVADIFGTV